MSSRLLLSSTFSSHKRYTITKNHSEITSKTAHKKLSQADQGDPKAGPAWAVDIKALSHHHMVSLGWGSQEY